MGQIHSRSWVSPEKSREQTVVRSPVSRPRIAKPSKRRTMFSPEIQVAGEIGVTRPRRVPTPLTPPVAKPFGILKK